MRATLSAALLVLALPALAQDCSWANTGADRYRGTTLDAIMSFTEIPYLDRWVLMHKISVGKKDDVVAIGQSTITGSSTLAYGSEMRDMHFGKNRRCGNVSRLGWAPTHVETAEVYRVGSKCVIRPDACGNWAWTTCDLTARAAATRRVPEPSTLYLVIAALLLILWVKAPIKRIQ